METIATTPALEFAPYIILLPMLAFPVILFLGKIFNGNKMWKDGLKEGGLIALPVMAASLLLALWLVTDFVGGRSCRHERMDVVHLRHVGFQSNHRFRNQPRIRHLR